MGTDSHYSHLLLAISLIQVLLIPKTTALEASPQLLSLTSHSQVAVKLQWLVQAGNKTPKTQTGFQLIQYLLSFREECVCACVHVLSHIWFFCDPRDSPTRLLCPWEFPGKNTGVGCHFLLRGGLPNPGIKPMSPASPALAGGFFITESPGNPFREGYGTGNTSGTAASSPREAQKPSKCTVLLSPHSNRWWVTATVGAKMSVGLVEMPQPLFPSDFLYCPL